MRKILLYALVITLPLLLGALTAQSARYDALWQEVRALNVEQEEWVEANKRLVTDIASLSSPERIGGLAVETLGLEKKAPEDVLQIKINASAAGKTEVDL